MPNWVILPYQGEERVAVSWPAGIERSRGLCSRVVGGFREVADWISCGRLLC